MDAYGNLFRHHMDELNVMMKTRGIDQKTRVKVRNHLHESYFVLRARHNQQSMSWLSSGLRGEIAIESGLFHVCSCVYYLTGFEDKTNCITDLAQFFVPDMFSVAFLHMQGPA